MTSTRLLVVNTLPPLMLALVDRVAAAAEPSEAAAADVVVVVVGQLHSWTFCSASYRSPKASQTSVFLPCIPHGVFGFRVCGVGSCT